MLSQCTGALGWTEAEFWASSFPGIVAALEGFSEFHGGAKPDAALSQAELDEMVK